MESTATKPRPIDSGEPSPDILALQEAPTVVPNRDIFMDETQPRPVGDLLMEVTTRVDQMRDQHQEITNFSKLKIDDEDQTKKTDKDENLYDLGQDYPSHQNTNSVQASQSKVQKTSSALLQSDFLSQITQKNCTYMGNGLYFISGEKMTIIHEMIFDNFGPKVLDKIHENQTVIESSSGEDNKLDNEEQIINFLSKSKKFKHVDKIEVLAQGGEAMVYKINHIGYEEVVLKVPLSKRQDSYGYEDLIHETQLIKAIYNENYVVNIKEEIIEVDSETETLLRYCVIEERARYSLYDLCCIKSERNKSKLYKGYWFKQENQENSLEKFSTEKFFYLFYQTMQTLMYLHSKGIVYSDMKPQNLLIMRNMKVKIGDFGVSILLDQKRPNQTYTFKGLTPSWCMDEIRKQYQIFQRQGHEVGFYRVQWKKEDLLQNDIYACCKCFETTKLNEYPNGMVTEKDQKIIDFFSVLQNMMLFSRCKPLIEAIEEVGQFLFQDPENYQLMGDLIQQMRAEKKHQAGFELCEILLKQKEFKQKEFLSEQLSLIHIKLLMLRGFFKFHQHDYNQTRIEHKKLEEFYKKDVKNIKTTKIKSQYKQLVTESRLQNAKSFLMQGKISEGEERIKEILPEIESDPELRQENILTTLELKGQLLMSKQQYPQALAVFQEYEEIIQQKKEMKSMILAKMNIANAYFRLQQYDKALAYYDQGMELCDGPVGKLDFEKSKGNVYMTIKEYRKAEEQFKKALKISQEVYGDKSVLTGEVYRQLADLHSHENQFDEAITLYKKAQSIYGYWYGKTSQQYAIILNNLGGVYNKQGNLAKAEESLVEALKINLTLNDQKETPGNIVIYTNLSTIKQKQGNNNAACVYFENVYTLRRQYQAFLSPEMLQTISVYIKLLLQTGKNQKANQVGEESLKEFEKQFGPKNEFVIYLQVLNAQILTKMEKYQQSFLLLKKAYAVVSEMPDNQQNQRRKFDLCKEMGLNLSKKSDRQAIQFFTEALKLCDPQNYLDKIKIQESMAVVYMKQDECAEAMKQLEYAEKNYQLAAQQKKDLKELEKEILEPLQKLKVDLKQHMDKASQIKKKKPTLGGSSNTSGTKSMANLKTPAASNSNKQATAKAPTSSGNKTLKPATNSTSKTMKPSKSSKKI